MHEPGISQHRVLHEFRKNIETQLWQMAAESTNGGGLQSGFPDPTPAARAKNIFLNREALQKPGPLRELSLQVYGQAIAERKPLSKYTPT